MSALSQWLTPKLSQTSLIFLTALFLAVANNQAFFSAVFKVVDANGLGSVDFKIALFIALVALFSLLLSLAAVKYVFKPFVILILLLAAVISFFMDSYGVILDESMIQNIIETDTKEATELLSLNLVKHLVLLGLLPAVFVYRVDIQYQSFFKELLTRLICIVLISALLATVIFTYYKNFALIDRNNRALRYLINPNYPIVRGGMKLDVNFYVKTARKPHEY